MTPAKRMGRNPFEKKHLPTPSAKSRASLTPHAPGSFCPVRWVAIELPTQVIMLGLKSLLVMKYLIGGI
ncbi:hypothetical protein WDW37_14265 [Bdellovibrionota bacterium FG-1]